MSIYIGALDGDDKASGAAREWMTGPIPRSPRGAPAPSGESGATAVNDGENDEGP